MFLSESHLPQLLSEDHYQSPQIYADEIERLFQPAWHCVATTALLQKEGDYQTCNLLGRPLLIYRGSDGIHAFLNVCTHRFSTLTDKPQGHFPGRIKCQYHGWEYDEQGCTCKIPDARQFRPLKKGQLGLREYRCATLGQLVFVTLSDQTPPLQQYLPSEFQSLISSWFTDEHRITLMNSLDMNCNWKIAMENILESYHIECVHPKSFTSFPVPEHCSHSFHPSHDHYVHDYAEEGRYARPERWIAKLTHRPPDYQWHHLLRYPNMILGGAGPFHYVQMLWPTSPSTCRSTWFTFQWSGKPGKLRTPFFDFWLRRYGIRMTAQVQREDADIYPSIHRGTVAPDRPHGGGLISAREERIFAFQRYWLAQIAPHDPVTLDENYVAACRNFDNFTSDVSQSI